MIHTAGNTFDFGPLASRYDRWYETPDGQAQDQVQKDDVCLFLHAARTGQTLLDVGCGTGHWSSFFAKRGYRVTGIDISPEMIKIAQSVASECSFQVANACELPFGNGSFDVVASMAALEFMADPATAVQEMVRCVKSGGSLLVGTLNRLARLNQHRLAKGKQPYVSAHLFSSEELRKVLSPWGRVRMTASSPPSIQSQPLQTPCIVKQISTFSEKFTGPFLVAEVQL